METENGKVVEVRGEEAVVEMEASEFCHHCGARFVCNSTGENRRRVTAHNLPKAKVGDRVTISYQPRIRILSSLVVFIFPVFVAIIGYIVASKLFETESSGIIGTFVGLIGAFVIVWLINKVFEKKKYLPSILKITN